MPIIILYYGTMTGDYSRHLRAYSRFCDYSAHGPAAILIKSVTTLHQ